jgi:uncharacterized cupin superfamily protein
MSAEEVEYLVEGSGITRVGEVDVRMQPGDVVVARPGEAHGFWNTSQTERGADLVLRRRGQPGGSRLRV